MGFIIFIFCSLFFSINASAVVVADGITYPSKIDSAITIKANLNPGENFVNWKITYGYGTFGNDKIYTTTFIPTTDSVVIEKITQKSEIIELSDEYTTLSYYKDGSIIPNGSKYAIRTKYIPKEDGLYAFDFTDFANSFNFANFANDETYTTVKNSSFTCNYSSSGKCGNIRFINLTKDERDYLALWLQSDENIASGTIKLRVAKLYTLTAVASDNGKAYVDSAKANLSSYTKNEKGDSVMIKSIPDKDYRFDHWEVTSGTCILQNKYHDTTYAVFKTTHCEVKAFFKKGQSYEITSTPTKYSTVNDFYAKTVTNGTAGVRFTFTAPEAGTYTIVVSNKATNEKLTYTSYKASDFATTSSSKSFTGTNQESFQLEKGQAIGLTVNSAKDNEFWISYARNSSSIMLSSDGNGFVTPQNGYATAYNDAKYSINATANDGYRFSNWQTISGNATIDEKESPFTFVSVNSNAEIKAIFKKNQVYDLTMKKQKFNFQENYYNEATLSTIRFKLSIPDTSTYIIRVKSIDSKDIVLADYGNDSTFTKAVSTYKIAKDSAFYIPKDSEGHIYWTIKNGSNDIPDNSFYAWISAPFILKVETSNEGSIYPNGEVFMLPNETSVITAWPYGGYSFNHWESIDGSFSINSPKKSRTKITIKDSICIIKASFDFDSTVKPSLKISNVDIGNLPGICTQVSVTDRKSGTSIFGLDTNDFVLKQDGEILPTQVTTIQSVTGISTVLVVDESNSMGINNRITKAKQSIRNYISEMGPLDRTSIVGFRGEDSTKIHQTMTSNKDSLFAAVDSIKAMATSTNINIGTYTGIEQVIGEINPTAVIVFSDGENVGSQSKTIKEILQFAKDQKTTLYTIGLESTVEDPLKTFADSTGGSFTTASDASELAGIYANIRDNVQSQYLVCYQNPDTLLNDEVHKISIQTNFAGKIAIGTATWHEGLLPPKITLTDSTLLKIQKSQPAKTAITIKANITATSKLTSVKIYVRKTSAEPTSFQSIDMQPEKDNLWVYTIPAETIVHPGVDFYIMATDSVGSIGKSPNIPAPTKEPYTIFVGNDIPEIKETQSVCDTTNGYKTFTFKISNRDGISDAMLLYKNINAVIFTEVPLTYDKKNDAWKASVPADNKNFTELEYYVRAIDTKGATIRSPYLNNLTTNSCEIKVPVSYTSDTIQIVNGDNINEAINRSTKTIKLSIYGNGIMEGIDTLKANLACSVSKDIITNITLIANKNGYYETVNSIPKNEIDLNTDKPKLDDDILSCTGADTLMANFLNPLSGKTATQVLPIHKYVATTYQFLKEKKDADLDSVKTTTKATFRLRITTTSNRANQIDTISAILFTAQGDSIKIKAIETDVNSAKFDYIGNFFFVDDSTSLSAKKLDAVLDLDSTWNRVKIQARLNSDSTSLKSIDSLIVYNNYIPADTAEIYDRDLDGKPDFVRIHFKKKLKTKIASIDSVFWNKGGDSLRTVDKKKIKINSNDAHWAEATLKKPFLYGVTKVNADNPPYLRFTKTSEDFSQKVFLKDKVGAVPLSVQKNPGKMDIDDYLAPSSEIPPDTLRITMSEPIRNIGTSNAWENLFRYSVSCEDTTSHPLKIKGTPKTDTLGLHWTVILADYKILKGFCLSTNPKATYEDYQGNSLGRGNVEIEGSDGNIYLYSVKPVRSINGYGDEDGEQWIPPNKNKWEDLPDSISAIKVESALPYTAYIYIFDGISTLVKTDKQKFGSKKEMASSIRGNSINRSKIGYLSWDQRSNDGRKVGTGVYIWKIVFKYDDGYKETRTLRTGILRRE